MTANETAEDAQNGSDPRTEGAAIPLWLQATVEDIQGLNFEEPIAGSDSADCSNLSTAYREAADSPGNAITAPAERVFAMLSAVTNFHFQPSNRNSPFGAMMVMGDRRSPIPEDFRGAPILVLADASERAENPVLRARLSDVCWLLERKRNALGIAAVAAYVATIEGLDSGRLRDRLDRNDPILGLTARDALRRALTIGRTIGWNNDEVVAARRLVSVIRERTIKEGNPVPVHWFFEMDMDFGISAPGELGAGIERYLNSRDPASNSHMIIELWRLAARAHHHAKDEESKYRCRVAAAEALVSEAQRHESAMLGSHWLSQAIAEYHGIPGKRERRTELRHKLIDIQSGISEEMSPFSLPIDLRTIIEHVQKKLKDKHELKDLLLFFADLERSPQPEKLIDDAIKSINDYPLSSIFGTSFHDHEGKVIHRSDGGGFRDDQSNDAIRVQIVHQEQIRRQLHSSGQVEVARRYINDHFYIGEDTFQGLLRYSPFVPNNVIGTFSRGFKYFFEGDYTGALYILTPMLENSLRHALKTYGHDVTTFDDARQIQEDRTISALFEQMRPELEDIFGKAIVADIDNVFLSKPGPSIRHALAHGLLNDASPYGPDAIYACWLIFRLCCIPLFGHRDEIELPT